MLQRFVAGAAVASVAVGFGAFAVLLLGINLQKTYPVPFIWCFVPLVWGVWAMLAPASWLPTRLPLWGAILGFVAAIVGGFVLNVPAMVFGDVPAWVRVTGGFVLMCFYYVLWMVVGAVYRRLIPATVPRSMAAKAQG